MHHRECHSQAAFHEGLRSSSPTVSRCSSRGPRRASPDRCEKHHRGQQLSRPAPQPKGPSLPAANHGASHHDDETQRPLDLPPVSRQRCPRIPRVPPAHSRQQRWATEAPRCSCAGLSSARRSRPDPSTSFSSALPSPPHTLSLSSTSLSPISLSSSFLLSSYSIVPSSSFSFFFTSFSLPRQPLTGQGLAACPNPGKGHSTAPSLPFLSARETRSSPCNR